jgi:hypothetical protein
MPPPPTKLSAPPTLCWPRLMAEAVHIMLERVFGPTISLSTGRVIPTRWVGEQHVQQDLGFIPSFADRMRAIRPLPWMGRAGRLEDQPTAQQRYPPTAARGAISRDPAAAPCGAARVRGAPGRDEPCAQRERLGSSPDQVRGRLNPLPEASPCARSSSTPNTARSP